MKPWFFALGFCLLAPVASRADSRTIDEVPRGHWSISAVRQLASWGVEPFVLDNRIGALPQTRYEMAVTTARAIDKFGYSPSSKGSIDNLSIRDVLVALVYEYRDELLPLTIENPLSMNSTVFENYLRYKATHKNITPSDWYVSFQEHPWIKDAENRSSQKSAALPIPMANRMAIHIFDEVPRDHWSISAARKMIGDGVGSSTSVKVALSCPVTRRDLALAIAHTMENLEGGLQPKTSDSNLDTRSIQDILKALTIEYRDDLALLFLERRRSSGNLEIQTNAEKVRQFTFASYLIEREKHRYVKPSDWYVTSSRALWGGMYFTYTPSDQKPRYIAPASLLP